MYLLLPIPLVFLSSLIITIQAAVLRHHPKCVPNFGNHSLSIFTIDPEQTSDNRVFKWTSTDETVVFLQEETGMDAFKVGDYVASRFVEKTFVAPDGYHTILDKKSNRTAFATTLSNQIVFEGLPENSRMASAQQFYFSCTMCLPIGVAFGCRISQPSTSRCVSYDQTSGTMNGQLVLLEKCNKGDGDDNSRKQEAWNLLVDSQAYASSC